MIENYANMKIKAITYDLATRLEDVSESFARIEDDGTEKAFDELISLEGRLQALSTEASKRIFGLLRDNAIQVIENAE